MKLKVLVVAGDGIGPEVTGEAVRVLRTVAEMGGHEFEFREELIGGVAIKKDGSPLPKEHAGRGARKRRGAAGRGGRK